MNKTFSYNGKTYFMDKLSSYSDINIKTKEYNDALYIWFYFTLNFSGETCEVSKLVIIKKYEDIKSWKYLFFRKKTKEYYLIKNFRDEYLNYLINEKNCENFIVWVAKRFNLMELLNVFNEYRDAIINNGGNK